MKHKYIGVGNGGMAGSVVYTAMFDPLSRGYAVGSTDTGHVGANSNDGAWALGHMDRVINFGQRGIHVMAMADKLVIRAHYGSQPAHSYFQGCSYGGKQALTEVQKYPADFDGVKDCFLNDPRRCHFDPSELRCKGGYWTGFAYFDSVNCLTGAQVQAG